MGLFGLFKPNVKKMEKKGDIEGLIKALSYKKDSRVRLNAAVALGRIGTRKTADALSKALKDEDSDVRKAVEKAIEKVKERK
jgi:HEAT repeat protein